MESKGVIERVEQRWLSTGEAADLCSVARDTVVKWIRRGRLPASRTAGGHYRISWDDVQGMVPAREPADDIALPPTGFAVRPMRCWGYLSATGEPREECRECLAYRVGATWCFLLRRGRSEGDASFCGGPESCNDCPYYRRVMGLPTRVLVITADAQMQDALRGGDDADVEWRFARTGYEAAALISGFRPMIAVVDAEVDHNGGASLVAHLTGDPRIRGVRIIVVVPRRGRKQAADFQSGHGVVEVVRKPFGPDVIRSLRDSLPVEPPDPRWKDEAACMQFEASPLEQSPQDREAQTRRS